MTFIVWLRRTLQPLVIAAVVGSFSLVPVLAAQFKVVDANGIKIGDVDSITSLTPIVALNLDGRWFSLGVVENGFVSTAQLNFESVDCSGTPLLFDLGALVGTPLLFSPAAIAPPGDTVFLPVLNSASEPKTLGSVSSKDGTCTPLLKSVETQVFPAQAIEDLKSKFAAPFKLEETSPAATSQ